MKKLIMTLAMLAAFVPASLLARTGERRFTRDGATYVYTVAPGAHGRQVIEGRRLPGNSAFRLVVDGDRVDGVSGGQPVSFRVAAPAGTTQVAAR